MKKILVLMCVVMLAGVLSMGCSNAAKKSEAPAPAVEQTEEPAMDHDMGNMDMNHEGMEEEMQEEETAAAPVQEYTFSALCDKVVAETKAGNEYFTDELAQQTKDACLQGSKAYEASPKATEAMAAFTKIIFDNCKDKSGTDWVMCYANQGEAAGKAAADAMMQQ